MKRKLSSIDFVS